MIDWLENFFTWFASFLLSIFSFIENLLSGLLDLIKNLPLFVSFLTSSVGNLPAVILPFASAGIVLSVVLLLVGRQNNS